MTKITTKNIDEMKKLRESGLSYSKIGIKLGIPADYVLYYLSSEYREKKKKNAREFSKERWKDKNYREKKLKYNRAYFKERYKTDLEYRKKRIKYSTDYKIKKRKQKQNE